MFHKMTDASTVSTWRHPTDICEECSYKQVGNTKTEMLQRLMIGRAWRGCFCRVKISPASQAWGSPTIKLGLCVRRTTPTGKHPSFSTVWCQVLPKRPKPSVLSWAVPTSALVSCQQTANQMLRRRKCWAGHIKRTFMLPSNKPL